MANDSSTPDIERIERALARIEKAAGERAYATDLIGRRHAALRERMTEAIAALDDLLAREAAPEEEE